MECLKDRIDFAADLVGNLPAGKLVGIAVGQESSLQVAQLLEAVDQQFALGIENVIAGFGPAGQPINQFLAENQPVERLPLAIAIT